MKIYACIKLTITTTSFPCGGVLQDPGDRSKTCRVLYALACFSFANGKVDDAGTEEFSRTEWLDAVKVLMVTRDLIGHLMSFVTQLHFFYMCNGACEMCICCSSNRFLFLLSCCNLRASFMYNLYVVTWHRGMVCDLATDSCQR